MKESPRYTVAIKNRHDKIYWYFRKRGYPRTRLPGLPWSDEFMAARAALLSGNPLPQAVGETRSAPGTIDALCAIYYASSDFVGRALTTQATYRGIIERFRATAGQAQVAQLDHAKVAEMLGRRSGTPSAANNWLKMLSRLMRLAITLGWRKDDPTVGIKPYKIRSDGFEIWDADQIEAFRARHATGTRARLAFELLLGTMQRRGDVVRMGRQHVRDGWLSIRQQKTGMLVEVPLLPEVQAEIAQLPPGQLHLLVTETGQPFTAAGFGNWFRDMCNAASVPKGYSAHGLRKAGATLRAEHGFTNQEIMAWGGWTTLKEVERYTKRANRRRLALSGLAKMEAK